MSAEKGASWEHKSETVEIVHFSGDMTGAGRHADVASHCNVIAYPRLHIDHSAHTGDGYKQSSGN